MVRLYACRSCMICTAFKIAYLGMTMPCAKKSQKKTSFVPFAVKLVVCASFKGDAHCAKMCGCIHTSFGGCARGAEQAISISSVDDIVHAKSYAFQKACLSHHPLMMSCIQRAMPIVHTFKALMCQSVHVQKCSPPWDARHPSRFSQPAAVVGLLLPTGDETKSSM